MILKLSNGIYDITLASGRVNQWPDASKAGMAQWLDLQELLECLTIVISGSSCNRGWFYLF